MSLPRTSSPRTPGHRRGLVALAAATSLLVAGLVTAPAAQALPVVDTHRSNGTTVTTSMYAWGGTIDGNVKEPELNPASAKFTYSVALKATGGTLLGARAEVTLQKIDRQPVRKRAIEMKRSSTGMSSRGSILFSGTIDPGTYRAGIEIFTVVRKPDGTRVRHHIDVNNAKTVQFKRRSWVDGNISSQATDGRPARIDAAVRVMRITDDGSMSWLRLRSGPAILSFDADGPYGDKKATFVRDLRIGSDGRISTVVESRKGWWKVTYPGTARFAESVDWVAQGVPGGCGC